MRQANHGFKGVGTVIECSNKCVYQQDGICTLSMAAPPGIGGSDCIHYVPSEPDKHAEGQKNTTDDEWYF